MAFQEIDTQVGPDGETSCHCSPRVGGDSDSDKLPIAESDEECPCCGIARGYIYTVAVYSEEELENVCPWCIAGGTLATKFDATLVDDSPLRDAGVSEAIIEEVTTRTPGYHSWQQESWICCCNDACEFHGDASRLELQSLDEAGLERLAQRTEFSLNDLRGVISRYQAGGGSAFYKFVCRHCGQICFHWEST